MEPTFFMPEYYQQIWQLLIPANNSGSHLNMQPTYYSIKLYKFKHLQNGTPFA